MKYLVDSPSTLFDMAELSGSRTQLHWAVVREMWSSGETFSLRADGKLIGVFGLFPIENGAEAWFNVRPEAALHMNFLIRQIRLTLASRSYPEIVVLCTSKAGSRIARLVGFRFVENTERGDIWHVRTTWIQQGRRPSEKAGGSAAAADARQSCSSTS